MQAAAAVAGATRAGPGALERYYRFHARIYDATRWSFLFGRTAVLEALPGAPREILEVGCGTGRNLAELARRYPRARLTGVDLSDAMLARARRRLAPWGDRVQLEQRAYGGAPAGPPAYDVVLFSYALSMFNPGWEAALAAAWTDLRPGGWLAVVDFHATTRRWFERWMGVNHVRMQGHLQPALARRFQARTNEVHAAYGGLWSYLLFVGEKAPPRKPET